VAPFWLNKEGAMQMHLLFLALAADLFCSNGGLFAQAVEGKVELPQERVERIANQRYEVNPDMHSGLPDPPAAVVYLEGALSRIESPGAPLISQMAQKNINFSPGILPIQVGTTVEKICSGRLLSAAARIPERVGDLLARLIHDIDALQDLRNLP